MHLEYRDRADFFVVYISEAHPGETLRDVDGGQRRFGVTRSLGDRRDAASACLTSLKLTMPFLVDDLRGDVERAYSARPNRIFVIDTDGRVAMRGRRGPRGVDIPGAERALVELLGRDGPGGTSPAGTGDGAGERPSEAPAPRSDEGRSDGPQAAAERGP